jgi:hypothetical protein
MLEFVNEIEDSGETCPSSNYYNSLELKSFDVDAITKRDITLTMEIEKVVTKGSKNSNWIGSTT